MATVGVSKAYYAIYNASGSTVTYSGGGSIGKATSVDIEIEAAEANELYADDAVAERDTSFSNGTLTLGTDDLMAEASKAILGVKEETITGITGITDSGAKELIYDDDQSSPYLGFGTIIKKKKNGVFMWRGIVLTKIQFNVPPESATTQGESIEWQTPELTAAIMRDDTTKHRWKTEATFTSLADADAYVRGRLNIAEAVAAVSEELEGEDNA